jgi:hypothetical protein
VRQRALLLAALAFVAACAPKFDPKGSVSVHGVAFHPTSCHAIGTPAGVVLVDADDAHLELALSPSHLEMGQIISGAPHVTFIDPHAAPRDLGTCGSLELMGEPYHGDGKRAVSGHARLACPGGTTADLQFTGCF